jgi:hypothetical protein
MLVLSSDSLVLIFIFLNNFLFSHLPARVGLIKVAQPIVEKAVEVCNRGEVDEEAVDKLMGFTIDRLLAENDILDANIATLSLVEAFCQSTSKNYKGLPDDSLKEWLSFANKSKDPVLFVYVTIAIVCGDPLSKTPAHPEFKRALLAGLKKFAPTLYERVLSESQTP